jgi:hypothetical protein
MPATWFDVQLDLKPEGERLYVGLFSGEDIHAVVNLLTQAAQFMDAERSRSVGPTGAGD